MAHLGLVLLTALGGLLTMRRGGRREQAGVAILAGAVALLWLAPDRAGLKAGALLLADLALVVLLGRLAWRAPSPWPIGMCAALAVGAASSLAFILQPDVEAQTYQRALLFTRYAAAVALLLDVKRHGASHS